MALTDIVPSHFPELYETEWRLVHQQQRDFVRQFMNVYNVAGDVRKFHRLDRLAVQTHTERADDGPGPRITAPKMGKTEIVNLYPTFYFSDPAEVDRREAIQLGQINSPHSSLMRTQAAAMMRQMCKVGIDGVLNPRKLGKTGGTDSAMPSGPAPAADNVLGGSVDMSYSLIDDAYTLLGTNQVLGQQVDGQNTWACFMRHKDLQKLRNDDTLKNRDFSDIRPIDRGTIYEFRGGYIVCVEDDLFSTADTYNPAGVITDIRLPFFSRNSAAFGVADEVYATADVIPEWHNNVLLQLEAGFGCTALDWEGCLALDVIK